MVREISPESTSEFETNVHTKFSELPINVIDSSSIYEIWSILTIMSAVK